MLGHLSLQDRIFDDYPDVFDVFHPSNVSRYIEFTENPQLWTDKGVRMRVELTQMLG